MDEARMEKTESRADGGDRGLVHGQCARRGVGDQREARGRVRLFEGEKVPFGQIGYTLAVLQAR